MRDLSNLNIAAINDSKLFERLCCDIWKNDATYRNVDLNGSNGQSQQGVDIFGRNLITNEWFGIQCKVRQKKLTKKEIEEEVEKAKKFKPSLKEYIICTTTKRDAKLQEIVRKLNTDECPNKTFEIKLLFWDDIEDLLKSDKNFNILHRYYKDFFVDNTTLGHAIGKLINLDLGIGSSTDTHYDLMIGKIPKYIKKEDTSVDYYQGAYFIINFHEKRMEVFKLPCFDTDIEQAFSNEFDRFRITKWLNEIDDIDKFIYDSNDSFLTSINFDDYKKRLTKQ